jgi:hypothetical protein
VHKLIQNLEEGGVGNHEAIQKMEARIEKQEQENIWGEQEENPHGFAPGGFVFYCWLCPLSGQSAD